MKENTIVVFIRCMYMLRKDHIVGLLVQTSYLCLRGLLASCAVVRANKAALR